MQEEPQLEQCEINTLTIDWIHKSVTCDESRPRLQVSARQRIRKLEQQWMQQDVREINTDVDSWEDLNMKPVNVCNDDSDESSRQTLKPVWLDDNASDESGSRDRCNQLVEKADASDESRSQGTRCSMSNPQQAEQPVTPVMQTGCIESTRVNMHDIDECLVTNKHTNVKQNSVSMSNHWLSSTFSVITSGILGKSKKDKTGKEFTENVDTKSKTMVFKPEFNFFL